MFGERRPRIFFLKKKGIWEVEEVWTFFLCWKIF